MTVGAGDDPEDDELASADGDPEALRNPKPSLRNSNFSRMSPSFT